MGLFCLKLFSIGSSKEKLNQTLACRTMKQIFLIYSVQENQTQKTLKFFLSATLYLFN